MNFIPVEGILSTNIFNSIRKKEFSKAYALQWLNSSEKKYKMKHFFSKFTLSCPSGYDHSCRFLTRRETLGCEWTARFLHQILERSMLIRNFYPWVLDIPTTVHLSTQIFLNTFFLWIFSRTCLGYRS